ncbi:MAG: glycosyltransferase family 2 protein [Leptolyngbya sp. BL-A-14]
MEKDQVPLVSVVITVRNAEAYISETLDSLLQEREVPIEIVLVDNGCTDSTVEKALAFKDNRIRIIEGPKKGIAHALNVAYANVRGEIVMRCDGDDLFPPGRIKQQVRWLEAHPEFGAICGRFSSIDSQGKPLIDFLTERKPEEITEELHTGEIRTHIGTFAIRTDVIRAAGGSREYFNCFEDFDFQLRLSETCRIWFEPEPYYIYRIHATSSTHSASNVVREFLQEQAFRFQVQRRTEGSDDLQRGCPPPVPEHTYKSPRDTAEHLQDLLIAGAWMEHRIGNKKQALFKGLNAVLALPTSLKGWHNLLFLVLKRAGTQKDEELLT